MKNKILVLSLSFLAFSSVDALAVIANGSEGDVVFPDVYASAYANITWSGLQITSTNGGTLALYEDFEALSMARADNLWHNDYNPSVWKSPLSEWDSEVKNAADYDYNDNNTSATNTPPIVTALYTIAESHGETPATNDVSSSALIVSESDVRFLPGDGGDYTAVARAKTGQAYEVTAGGMFKFSIPYFVDWVTFNSREDEGEEYAAAWAWSWLRLYNWGTGAWDPIFGTYVESTSNESGTFEISYAFTTSSNPAQPTYIAFEAGADTIASITNPVPVPPSVLMLLTGCTSLFFMRRRKS
jgi:hypothetical protein